MNTPPGIHDVQPVRRLRLVKEPLAGQKLKEPQPIAIDVNGNEEYEVEKILREWSGRLLVKWKGYATPTWESRDALTDTIALDAWEKLAPE